MKTIYLTIILTSSLCFSQSKKEAYQMFKISEARHNLEIPISDFAIYYKDAKCLSKAYKIKLSDMPIFKNKLSEDEFVDNGRFRQSLFGLGDTIFPERMDNGKKTKTCNAFPTSKY